MQEICAYLCAREGYDRLLKHLLASMHFCVLPFPLFLFWKLCARTRIKALNCIHISMLFLLFVFVLSLYACTSSRVIPLSVCEWVDVSVRTCVRACVHVTMYPVYVCANVELSVIFEIMSRELIRKTALFVTCDSFLWVFVVYSEV